MTAPRAHTSASACTLTGLRQKAYFNASADIARAATWLPQDKYIARPINRLLGGPSQPLSSALLTSYLTDLTTHQLLPKVISAVVLRDSVHLYPDPFLSTGFVLGWGLPVALYKLGRFHHQQQLQNISVTLVCGDAKLGRLLSKRVDDAMRQPAGEASTQALIKFFADHHSRLSCGAQRFVLRLRAKDSRALAALTQLRGTADIYTASKTEAAFASLLARLDDCVQLEPVHSTGPSCGALLFRDAAKTILLAAALCLQWYEWHRRYQAGEPNAQSQLAGGVIVGLTIGLTALFTASVAPIPKEFSTARVI